VQPPGAAQHDVDHARAVAHQELDGVVVGETLPQARIAVGERCAEGGDAVRIGDEGGESERSRVITVHPSGSSFTSRRPALTIGSMVNVMPGRSSSPVPALP
jgi:hypothetical protein